MTVENSLKGHDSPCISMHAINETGLLSGSEDGVVCKWDLQTSKRLTQLKTVQEPSSIQPHPSQPHNVYIAAGTQLLLWDLRTPNASTIHECSDDINSIHLHPSASYLSTVDDSGTVQCLDTATWKPFRKFRASHSGLAMDVAFRPRRTWESWSGGTDCQLKQWDCSKGTRTGSICFESTSINPAWVNCISFDSSGNKCVAGLGDGSIRLVQPHSQSNRTIDSMEQVTLPSLHCWSVSQIQFHPNSDATFLSSSIDGSISVWNSASHESIYTPVTIKTDHKVNSACFLPLNSSDKLHFVEAGTARKSAKSASDAYSINIISIKTAN